MTTVAKNTVVTFVYRLTSRDGEVLEESEEPHSYLHGGYGNVFEAVEKALEGKTAGDTVDIVMEPEEAFGEYDEELVRVEDRAMFPEEIEVGMQFEGQGESSGEINIYTVTDIAEDKVVVDGNHPLAGQSLKFHCKITEVRAADPHEIEHGHAHGAHGHHHH
ncbi:MAG: peptidylprolyl isomerase [Hydrogenophilaceae bacterium]|jgi:FKBP-type peptidyl-prolyl cis-trans isomerase SlyD|nr:peptidylprolyl isomerase [Hydrogenophilaceae bacterium]